MENRKEVGLPKERCVILIKRYDGEYICEWEPYNEDDYNFGQPTKGYLGTAEVIFGEHKGIGFHAWEQNDSEFIYYKIIYRV